MKKILILAVMLTIVLAANAQTVILYKDNVLVAEYKSSEVNKVMFEEHESVNLGLSVKWATCNIGADKPEDYGDYFAWGETTGYNGGKTNFFWTTYTWCNGSYTTMTKYCTQSKYGTVDNKTVLDPADDAAIANWGNDWRMPTKAEWEELKNTDNCTWTWYEAGNTEYNGVAGYKVTSKKAGYTTKFIFLPAAGCRWKDGNDSAGSGYYWSSSLNTDGSYTAWNLYCGSYYSSMDGGGRYYGRSVRPVR